MKNTMIDGISLMMTAFERNPNPSRIAIYARVLSNAGFTGEEVNRAIDNLLLTAKFCPSINEIAAEIKAIREFDNPTKPLPWSEAWGILEREYNRVGKHGKPTLERPELQRLIKEYGWHNFCNAYKRELAYLKATLVVHYFESCKGHACDTYIDTATKQGKEVDDAIRGLVKTW